MDAGTVLSRLPARELEQVHDEDVLAANGEVVSVRELLNAADLIEVFLEDGTEGEEGEIDGLRFEASLLEPLGRLGLAEDGELHQVGDTVRREQSRQERDEVVHQVPSPEIDGAVTAGLAHGID